MIVISECAVTDKVCLFFGPATAAATKGTPLLPDLVPDNPGNLRLEAVDGLPCNYFLELDEARNRSSPDSDPRAS